MAIQRVHVETNDAAPVKGSYTDFAAAHADRAHALACSLVGDGFENFASLTAELQHSILSLLSAECWQTVQALKAQDL